VVFDACRNELLLPTKDTSKGLVPVAEQQGMFIAYASAPGRTASDKGEKSGPYAAALASELGKPGLDHLNLFQNVKEAVLASTDGVQQPWENNGLGRRVFLTGPSRPSLPITPSTLPMSTLPTPLPTTALPTGVEIVQFCQSIAGMTSKAVVQSLLETYRGTPIAGCVQARLGELIAMAVPSPRPREATESVPAPQPVTPCQGVETQVGNERKCLKEKETFKDCPDCPDMVVVPAGEFTMGSPPTERGRNDNEGPQHSVKIAKPFAVGKFSVTVDQFTSFVTEKKYDVGSGCLAGR
jgi:hypothetical protein